jgi:hypothetical protein
MIGPEEVSVRCRGAVLVPSEPEEPGLSALSNVTASEEYEA